MGAAMPGGGASGQHPPIPSPLLPTCEKERAEEFFFFFLLKTNNKAKCLKMSETRGPGSIPTWVMKPGSVVLKVLTLESWKNIRVKGFRTLPPWLRRVTRARHVEGETLQGRA